MYTQRTIPFHQVKLTFKNSKNMRITSACYTDAGDRNVNEDSIFTGSDGKRACYVLADGLGGHGMGDEASKLAIDVASTSFFEKLEWEKTDTEEIFQATQDMLLVEQQARNVVTKMKTTMSFLAIDDNKCSVGWIGDSRVYWFRTDKSAKKDAIKFAKHNNGHYGAVEKRKKSKESNVKYYFPGGEITRTSDHSIPQGQFDCGEISESEIRYHSKRGFLISALGERWDDNVADKDASKPYETWKIEKIQKGDAFLLCSDGFWELIEEKYMMEYLEQSSSVDEWLKAMIDHVNRIAERQREKNLTEKERNWSMDNYSAIAVCVM